MPKKMLALAASLLAVGISGCGINALRIEAASQVSLTSEVVVTQAKAALTDAGVRRERAFATLIASDTSCLLVDPVYIFVPNGPPGAAQAPLCASSENAVFPGYRAAKLDFLPISNEALKPTLTLIGAVADYGDALAKIVKRPKTDISKELAALAAKANQAKTLAEGLAGLDIPDIPDLAGKQAKTAIALAQFIDDLVEEQGQVDDIRKVVLKHSDKLPGIIAELTEQVDIWQNIMAKGYAQVNTANIARAYEAERTSMNFESRQAMVVLFRQTQRDARQIPVTCKAFGAALEKFGEANTDLRKLLAGELTPEQRRKADDITAQRILGGLKLIAEAITAWGVLI